MQIAAEFIRPTFSNLYSKIHNEDVLGLWNISSCLYSLWKVSTRRMVSASDGNHDFEEKRRG